jgi:hypothetical protein
MAWATRSIVELDFGIMLLPLVARDVLELAIVST